MRLRDMLLAATETREECCALRARVSDLQQEITEKRAWEEDKRVALVKESDKQIRDNQRLSH